MKRQLKLFADRIDQMKLRERGLIFAMAALIVVMLTDALFLEPLLARQKKLSEQVVQRQEQMKGIRAQIESLAQARHEDPNAVNYARLAELKNESTELEKFLQGKQERLVAPDKISGLLQQMLRHNQRLQLISLQTLPVANLVDEAAERPAQEVVGDRLVFKHGVEITVRGNYLALLDYLAELEKSPWRMFWGKAKLNAEQYPAVTLTLTLYTLSLDKAWLAI